MQKELIFSVSPELITLFNVEARMHAQNVIRATIIINDVTILIN